MKKWIALLVTLSLLFAFAAAETAELQTVNFREIATEEEIASGSYRQLGNLPFQIWVPNEGITEKEIPLEDGYEDVVLILIYNDNPANELIIESGLTEISFDQFVENLQSDDLKDILLDMDVALVNGYPVAAYVMQEEDSVPVFTYEYFIEDRFVKFSFKVTEETDDSFEAPSTMITLSLEALP